MYVSVDTYLKRAVPSILIPRSFSIRVNIYGLSTLELILPANLLYVSFLSECSGRRMPRAERSVLYIRNSMCVVVLL